MATDQHIAAAVDRAVETATVDPDGPADERVQFDPEALAAVTRLCDSERNLERVLAVVDRELAGWVDGLEVDRSLAAMTLVHRIEAAATKRQVVVENIQGDVGTGRGPAAP